MSEDNAVMEANDKVREFNLHVKNTEESDSVVGVRWCTSEQVRSDLIELGATRPYILFQIFYFEDIEDATTAREVSRKLVAFDEAMTFIQFQRPGHHRVLASILWHEKDPAHLGRFGTARSTLLNRCKRSLDFDRHLSFPEYIGDDRHDIRPREHVYFNLEREHDLCFYERSFLGSSFDPEKQGVLNLKISPEFFAPEPPEWQKNWVNMWFKNPPVDQCAYRKRKWFFAYPIQPFLYVIAILGGWVFTVLEYSFYFLFGFWRSFRASEYPRRPVQNNVFLTKKVTYNNGVDQCYYDGRKLPIALAYLLFLPIVWVLIAVSIASPLIWGWESSLAWSFFWLGIYTAFAVPLFATVVLISHNVIMWMKGVMAKSNERKYELAQASLDLRVERARKKKELERDTRERYFGSLDDLVCPSGSKTKLKPSLDALPPQRVSIRLRVEDLKKRVCRPFASG